MNERIEAIRLLRESEDHVEFKEAKKDFNFNGGSHADPTKRRHCVLGYVVALANEGGGLMVFGISDNMPHEVVGLEFGKGEKGEMEAAIHKSLGIRVHIEEEYDNEKRVMIINVPSRPKGRYLTFEGVPLMRVGEQLQVMSQDELFAILSENEPEFSETLCEGLCVEDLDDDAIRIMQQMYAEKNKNPAFATLSAQQALNDLELVRGGKLTYAALILLGKTETIHRYLPQDNVVIEYRRYPSQIPYDAREEYQMPLYNLVDAVWAYVNQPLLNPQYHVQRGAYIFDIIPFDKETVREAVLNAIAHRAYGVGSDVVVKLSPNEMHIINAGGFPKGVSAENVLTTNSVPRNKLLMRVMQKTGLVEKSGQGVDKMYYNSIMDSKQLPDYTLTDLYQVHVRLYGEVMNPAFVAYVRSEQDKRPKEAKLNVFELLAMYDVAMHRPIDAVCAPYLNGLQSAGLLVDADGAWQLGAGYEEMVEMGAKSEAGITQNEGKNDTKNDTKNDIKIDLSQLTDRQQIILLLMRENGAMTIAKMTPKLRVSKSTILRDLKAMRKLGVLDRDGESNGGKWVLLI